MSSLRACVAISQTAAPRPEIFDPGTQNGTISNQIVVLPDGHAGGRFYLFKTHGQKGGNSSSVRPTRG
jgi:hypothetical protein